MPKRFHLILETGHKQFLQGSDGTSSGHTDWQRSHKQSHFDVPCSCRVKATGGSGVFQRECYHPGIWHCTLNQYWYPSCLQEYSFQQHEKTCQVDRSTPCYWQPKILQGMSHTSDSPCEATFFHCTQSRLVVWCHHFPLSLHTLHERSHCSYWWTSGKESYVRILHNSNHPGMSHVQEDMRHTTVLWHFPETRSCAEVYIGTMNLLWIQTITWAPNHRNWD